MFCKGIISPGANDQFDHRFGVSRPRRESALLSVPEIMR